MLLALVRRSFVAAIFCVSSCVAHGSRHSRRTASVASSPLESIPGCALSCVKIFIESDYPTNACASLVLDCLCRTNTKSGYTLGEAALRCNLSFCPMTVTESSDVYNICDSVAGAVPKTHATITATVMSTIYPTAEITTTTTSPSTLLTTSTTTMTTTDTKATTSSSTSSTLASFETPLTVTHSAQTSSSTTSDQLASSTSTATSSGLNAGAVIGVSVTSGVAGFFILGVIIFFCCRRLRRQHEKIGDRDFFEIGGAMSEPPDFGLPLPRRPIQGPPNPSFSVGSQQSNSETARLMSPFQPATRNPVVVVRGPGDYHFAYDSPDRIGFAVSTNSEFGASPSQTSERTVSDLLPDKPNMNLYPKPLRWSSHKPSRHMSSDTLFEEDAVRPRSLLGSSNQNKGSMGGTSGHNGSQQYRPTMGLPSNPRAMLYGMDNAPLSKKNVGYGAKPVFANTGERIAHYQQAEICNDPRWYAEAQMPDQQDYTDSQWLYPRTGYGQSDGRQSTRGAARRSVELVTHDDLVKAPTDGFETISLKDRSELRRKSRRSGDFKPLTPVREVVTPSVNAGKNDGGGYFGNGATVPNPRIPFSGTAPPVQEIVSRPRIVRGDDIKRVQIRKGKPQPQGPRAPYSPEDGWLETRDTQTQYSDHKSKRLPVDPSFPVEGMAPATPRRKPVSWGRNLTPARRGSDLILRVD
ncbi:uncharacterized protein NFIA_064950 [Aspergillus fischeri NRRL 181]|uniref:Extracellular membrane protein CFEM domain-containing protein n=1 Tax=Neosartorya fischeri (strain ATCC 1020 / DSM 3700 / CBS 544.65 / FGSC A1164 / JCM 1740 / NRRL 181 / WB 181) TaxID=331117 RepID=A1D6I7_NEOFI|nr:conserved hypothetical protein [Aspergillus fischeri NRRL 181]EAW21331.1 conserved hypothetical protein [Aspergillus fischeri NRRL 181]KAG2014803.1 hypothetical protein GB937_006261 [Aspergillus fischeri]